MKYDYSAHADAHVPTAVATVYEKVSQQCAMKFGFEVDSVVPYDISFVKKLALPLRAGSRDLVGIDALTEAAAAKAAKDAKAAKAAAAASGGRKKKHQRKIAPKFDGEGAAAGAAAAAAAAAAAPPRRGGGGGGGGGGAQGLDAPALSQAVSHAVSKKMAPLLQQTETIVKQTETKIAKVVEAAVAKVVGKLAGAEPELARVRVELAEVRGALATAIASDAATTEKFKKLQDFVKILMDDRHPQRARIIQTMQAKEQAAAQASGEVLFGLMD